MKDEKDAESIAHAESEIGKRAVAEGEMAVKKHKEAKLKKNAEILAHTEKEIEKREEAKEEHEKATALAERERKVALERARLAKMRKDAEEEALLRKELEEELAKAMADDYDASAKLETEDEKDHKLLNGAKFVAGKTKNFLSTVMKMAITGLILGSPMLGVLGVLSVKYNQPLMNLCKSFGYSPMLMPNLQK